MNRRFYNLPRVSSNRDTRTSGEMPDRSPITRRKRLIAEIMAEDNRPLSPRFVNPHNEIYRRNRIPTPPAAEGNHENHSHDCPHSSLVNRPPSSWRYHENLRHRMFLSSQHLGSQQTSDDDDNDGIESPSASPRDTPSQELPCHTTIVRLNTPRHVSIASLHSSKPHVRLTHPHKKEEKVCVLSPKVGTLPPRSRKCPKTCVHHHSLPTPPPSSTPPGPPSSPTYSRANSSNIYPVTGTNPQSTIKPHRRPNNDSAYNSDSHYSKFHQLILHSRNSSQLTSTTERPPSGVHYSHYHAPPTPVVSNTPAAKYNSRSISPIQHMSPVPTANLSQILELTDNLKSVPAEKSSNFNSSIVRVDEGTSSLLDSMPEMLCSYTLRRNRPILPSISDSETFGDGSLFDNKLNSNQPTSTFKEVTKQTGIFIV